MGVVNVKKITILSKVDAEYVLYLVNIILEPSNVSALLVLIIKMDNAFLNAQAENTLIAKSRNVYLIVSSLLRFGKIQNVNVLKDFIEMQKVEYVIQAVGLSKLEFKEFANVLMAIIKEYLVHVFEFLVHLVQDGIQGEDNVVLFVQV